jgi:hypothetical protein
MADLDKITLPFTMPATSSYIFFYAQQSQYTAMASKEERFSEARQTIVRALELALWPERGSAAERELAESEKEDWRDFGSAERTNICVRCFRLWEKRVQSGGDIADCVFDSQQPRKKKCEYCSTRRSECIPVSQVTEPQCTNGN